MFVIKCIRCKESKDEAEFSTFRGRKNKTCDTCRARNNKWYAQDIGGRKTKAKVHYQKNKDRVAVYRSEHRLKKRYELTKDSFNEMLLKQNHRCAIRGESFEDRKPCVDHSHTDGSIRGLLCRRCNLDLRVLEDKEFVEKAKSYLKSKK